MPTNDDPYDQVLAQFASVVDALRMHKDVVNRAINLLNHEVLSLAKRFDDDDKARSTRQQQIDAKMEAIIVGQEQIKRWQAVRLGIEIAAILIVVAFFYGVSR